MSTENNGYEVGYKKPPVATRYKKGECGNRKGRPKKIPQELDPGKILQLLDNEELMVNIDGKRKRMPKAEIHFRQLFTKAIKGRLPDARLIAKMIAEYYGPEAEEPSETLIVIVDKKGKPIRKLDPGKRGQTQLQVSTGSVFRKVASELISIEIDGTQQKVSRLDAYLRQIHIMALNNDSGAERLVDWLRRRCPGDLLPGDPIIVRLSENEAKY